MSLLNWIFDLYQQHRIGQLHEENARLRQETAVRSTGGGIDAARLERALGELALAVKAVQRLAVEKGLCTEDEILETLQRVDREDGRADGRAPIG